MAPSTAIVANQTIMIGPKTPPMLAVPRFCTQKRPNKIATVSGTTTGLRLVVATSSPSTALSTEMAGVMTPSP